MKKKIISNSREFKSSKEKEKTAARSKALSSIKNVGTFSFTKIEYKYLIYDLQAGNKLKSFANEKLKNVMKNNQKL